MRVVVVGGGKSALDLDGLAGDIVLGIQSVARRYPQLIPRFTHFFLNSLRAHKYRDVLPPDMPFVCTEVYVEDALKRNLRPGPPPVYTVHARRALFYGTGPEAIIWAASRPGVEQVTICGFDPSGNHLYRGQQKHWPAAKLELGGVPVYESETCTLGQWPKDKSTCTS